MDQVKIGKFIATCRKEQNLTQMQLAEMLGITDRAVSKWERGIAMPDSSIMLTLCRLLHITVTDLLNGEKVNMEQHTIEAENKLIELMKQKEQNDKMLLTLEVVIGVLSALIIFIPCILGAVLTGLYEWQRVLICFSGFIPGLVGFFFATKIEQLAGYYECKACGHRYVPTYKSVCGAMHMGRTRYMTCPQCGKKSWQTKHIRKQK